MNELSDYKDNGIQVSDLTALDAYRNAQQTRGPQLRGVVRGNSVDELLLNIDHIDMPLSFDQLFHHEQFWMVFKVIGTPELDRNNSFIPTAITEATGVTGKRIPKPTDHYTDAGSVKPKRRSSRKDKQADEDSDASASGRRDRKKHRPGIDSDDDSGEDTVTCDNKADDSSIATISSWHYSSRENNDVSLQSRAYSGDSWKRHLSYGRCLYNRKRARA